MRSAAAQPEQRNRDATPKQELSDSNSSLAGFGKDDVVVEEDPAIEVEVAGEPDGKAGATGKEVETESELDALKKQLEALKASEKLAQEQKNRALKAREEMAKQTATLQAETTRGRSAVAHSQLNAIETALGAAQTDLASAEKEAATAAEMGDYSAQAVAFKKIANAQYNISKLEDGRDELQTIIQRHAEETKRPQKPQGDPIDQMPIPDQAKEWLRAHPEFVNDQRKNVKLQATHWDLLEEGFTEFSQEYLQEMEQRLLQPVGRKKAGWAEDRGEGEVNQPPAAETEREISASGGLVSAPVSRSSTPSASTPPSKVRLTREQAELADQLGLPRTEYARQLLELNRRKQLGELQQ